MAYHRKSKLPYNDERRRHALMRLLAFDARRTGKPPVSLKFSKRVQYAINYHGGVRALLHEYARNGCPKDQRAFFDRLVAQRSRRRPAGPGLPYWHEVRIHRELVPYIEQYLESCGRFHVVRALVADRKFGLLQATRRSGWGGMAGLFERWQIDDELPPYIANHLLAELDRLFPWHGLRQLFPTSREVYAVSIPFHDFIMNHGHGYRQSAALIGWQTQRDRRDLPSRRRLVADLGTLILQRGGLPPKEEFGGRRFEAIRNSPKSIEQFLQDMALDRHVQESIDDVRAQLKAALRNGLPPEHREGIKDAHSLFRRIIERCERT